MSIFTKVFGDPNGRVVRSLLPFVGKINSREPEFGKLSEVEILKKTEEFKKRISGGETLDDLLPDAFAAVREAARRVLGQRHFDVQLMGGVVLHQGKIAEMKTGEGKTLVATLPLYLNSLAGKGCHLVTPNDYLSRVGGGWMGPVYHALGVSVGVIAHDFSGIYDPDYQIVPSHGDPRLDHWRPCSRHEAYMADITYGTNNEFGFDYLRDNMAYRMNDLGQREHYFAIVDEIDSILIDEARTPLIISMPDQESSEYYRTFAGIVPQLKENIDYNVDAKLKAVTITEDGIENVEKLLGVKDIYTEKGFRYVRYLEQALRAQALFQRDRDYVVKDDEVIIVDEFTGRLMPGRRWSEGLHQAVEAKEGVRVQQESRTLATVTFQNYFRMYAKLAGMTGTAATNAEEFHKVYNLDVITIPTNRAMVRRDLSDLVFRTEHGKFLAVASEIKKRHELGQPVLVGTVSIEKNERLSEYLRREGIPHEVLNAKNHEREASIIAQAGKPGSVTLATNMAGRGVDIILGGNPVLSDEAREAREAGGLHIIGTERHEARRIDNQLRGRAGRQGDPGSSQFFVSLEDDLMRVFGGSGIKQMMENFGIPEDQPIENRLVTKAIETAQSRIEGFHFDSRKHLLEFDDVLNKQRDWVYRMRKQLLVKGEDLGFLEGELYEFIAGITKKLVDTHCGDEVPENDWNTEEIFESVRALAEIDGSMHAELEQIRNDGQMSRKEKHEAISVGIKEALMAAWRKRREGMEGNAGRNILRAVMLQSGDVLWMDHLDIMEHLRDSVRLRAYGQRDPLVEYKHEGARLFRELKEAFEVQAVSAAFKIGSAGAPQAEKPHGQIVFKSPKEGLENNGIRGPVLKGKQQSGRNDPCPCGSGKKYKKCHGG
ncbi:MAG: preprotein translocase subunit SecA [Candidatus Sungbacteria bacterium]|nr:preprotein translocase subunit SecA [Candidatus Sungbacteria bacterium]